MSKIILPCTVLWPTFGQILFNQVRNPLVYQDLVHFFNKILVPVLFSTVFEIKIDREVKTTSTAVIDDLLFNFKLTATTSTDGSRH